MFIKWKYCDHGWPDFKELEIPDDLDGYETVVGYLCGQGVVPTWSERFCESRIKWEKIEKSPAEIREILLKKIAGSKRKILAIEEEIKWFKHKIDEIDLFLI